jgi:hypothetical protein
MTSFGGAPIMNNGYYDVPINNQYSNKGFARNNQTSMNTYQVNRNINTTMNNNQGNYMIYNEPTIPSPSLYYETDQSMSGYYQDPMYISSDAGVPLMKKKEMMYNDMNNKPYIESFNNSVELVGRGESLGAGSGYTLGPGRNIGTGYLNPQFIPNISRNYWSHNDPGYTNYYFVPPPIEIVQQPPPVMYREPQYNQQNYVSDDEIEIESLKEDVKNIIKESKENKKNKKNKNKNEKLDKKSKDAKDSKKKVDSKTLWNIIIILSFIIFCFILKLLYDYKVIRLNFRR